ncbi:hypothetical protein PHYBLDRAFT_67382 [Phycomyces blakesleeanus NRRL 1555(-)]|uniref:Uncharacterized protein n=1 Tax=Phycomyces blakesleeanus (strain ATCC 8743b / DSM 1359 / FGSC 10004 / NBRC 33097 / NRRL 1555) TaxID=763407 RepID=A0A162T665_PHYB8|nr:hypothetical protein PHYBLDRAFT_67382 [Phycomyces blakesleeanus NRRL 1555(-)]OAD66502.1 hypothetical protein PHYBLDRAFT_67382 [Phycomyces blakesleeanus NRRL 1555(-)]|eukprot:XP_018284542.1 hypothetical protein PHYBLDRAFT_67382 [Phycomyces blakesleeanus NRRL 1555(-)]
MSLSEHCALKINSLVFSFSLTSDVDSRILLTATHGRKRQFLGLDLSKSFERRGLLYITGRIKGSIFYELRDRIVCQLEAMIVFGSFKDWLVKVLTKSIHDTQCLFDQKQINISGDIEG